MPAIRIIPCLDCDLRTGKAVVVKGKRFQELREIGRPADMAKKYYEEGADELCFLDITASLTGRKTMLETIKEVGKEVFVPLTVGGGIGSLEEARAVFLAGADKVCINTAAVINPSLISQISREYGSQACVVAIDAKKTMEGYRVCIYGGKTPTGLEALAWAKKAQELGAGEILLTSIDADGTRGGFDIPLTRKLSIGLGISVIASGGAGKKQDFLEAARKGKADALLAAGVFHDGTYTIPEIKKFLGRKGITVRH